MTAEMGAVYDFDPAGTLISRFIEGDPPEWWEAVVSQSSMRLTRKTPGPAPGVGIVREAATVPMPVVRAAIGMDLRRAEALRLSQLSGIDYFIERTQR